MNEQEIVKELGTIMDRLAALPSDAFAERYPFHERQAELRGMLAAAQVEAGREAADTWADQAARKQPEGNKPFIEIHLPDGSMGGG